MENKTSQEEYIRKMLQSVAKEESISDSVEPAILEKIKLRKNYNDQLKQYQRRAKSGLVLSVLILALTAGLSTWQIWTQSHQSESEFTVFYNSIFAFAGLLFLFIMLEVYKGLGKKASMQNAQ